MPDKLPAKLDELGNLLDEVGGGWLVRFVARGCIDKIRADRLEEKLAECAKAAVDDYFTSWVSERTVQPQVMEIAEDLVKKTLTNVDRWAR